jgi:hypothetical protein
MRPAVLALLLALGAGPALAAPVDDSDLSRPGAAAKSRRLLAAEGRREGGALVFPLVSEPLGTRVPGKVTGRFEMRGRDGSARPTLYLKARVDRGPWTLLPSNGAFELDAPASGRFRVRVSLDNERWDFAGEDGSSYEWESADLSASAPGVDAGVLSPAPGSENAKLGALHLTYLDAAAFLAREAELAWWTRPYHVVWPGDSDHYQSWSRTITLSDALAWDVVLHELGHAVMDGAFDASGGGGAHKIDECYTPGLAWTEGWATYFAGAVALSPDDSDARFEFLVPRRAPVRLEHVPADVCAGAANEWRVAAGLWDLTDRHIDGEGSLLPFRAVWEAGRSGRTASVGDLWTRLSPLLDPGQRRLAQDALARNTLLSPAAPVAKTPRLPGAPAPRLFDGRKP